MHRHAFLFNSLLVCLLIAPAWGQTYNPTVSDPTTQNTPEGMGALPTCQVRLAACNNTLMSTQRKLARCTTKFNTCTSDLGNCQTDLDACEAEPQVVFPGDGVTGPALSYTDNGDGTFTDNNTQLVWEKKDDGGGVHDVDNTYTWTGDGLGGTAANGTLFTGFLPTLNTTPCFVGHCDWRMPNAKEVQSIVDYSTFNPAAAFPGPTESSFYWSSTSVASNPGLAWYVNFDNGDVNGFGKSNALLARAVRGGQ